MSDQSGKASAQKVLKIIEDKKNSMAKSAVAETGIDSNKDGYLSDDDFVSGDQPVVTTKKVRNLRTIPTSSFSLNVLLWSLFIVLDVALAALIYLFLPR